MSMNAVAAPAGTAPWYAGLTPRHWRILWGSYLGWVFDGYESLALIYALRPALHSLLTPQQAQAPAFYAGLTIGVTLLGWGAGGIAGGVLADYIGRKRMMMLAILAYALLTGVTAFANSFAALVVLRFATGVAIGSEWSTGVALVAESWPDRARPKGCGFLQSAYGVGALMAAVIWWVLAATTPLGAESWRILFALGALPALVCLYLRRSLDESERWVASLKKHHWSAPGLDGIANQTAKRPFTLVEVFREPRTRRLLLLATAMSFSATVGWWAVSTWLPTYAEGLAKSYGEPANLWGPRIGTIYTLGAIFAYVTSGFIADAIGRRWFLFLTFVGAMASTYLVYTWSGGLTLFAVFAFVNGMFSLGYAYSWMTIYLAELFTSPVRATASSVVFNGARLVAWVFPIIAGEFVTVFGGIAHAAMIMSSVYVIGLVVPWFMPETLGEPLPE